MLCHNVFSPYFHISVAWSILAKLTSEDDGVPFERAASVRSHDNDQKIDKRHTIDGTFSARDDTLHWP